MDHFAPHTGARFEGYYSKFDLPSGAHLALIITSVPAAKDRPHLVSFTYVSKKTNEYFQREVAVEPITMARTSTVGTEFELRAPGIGSMSVKPDSTTSYSIKHEDFSFSATTTTHHPWSSTTSTPEGLLVHLPLPLHWHVHSLGSACTFELNISNCSFLAPEDRSGIAVVHQEKNWANSFPSAHVWIQARQGQPQPHHDITQSNSEAPSRSICIAGGKIIGSEAYLLGYRSSTHPSCTPTHPIFELDFRPPFAMSLLGLSPNLTVKPDFAARSFTLSARDWRNRIDVHVSAPADTFFPLSAPFPDGHRDNLLAESFRAELKARVYTWVWGSKWWDVRGWWAGKTDGNPAVGHWKLSEEVVFEDASLEFGGEYYGFAGSKTRRGR